jgi:hypothetical protein
MPKIYFLIQKTFKLFLFKWKLLMQALWILDGNVPPLILANNTTFKVNIEALKASIDKATPTNDLERYR